MKPFAFPKPDIKRFDAVNVTMPDGESYDCIVTDVAEDDGSTSVDLMVDPFNY